MKIIKDGFGISKTVWSMTFKMRKKYPSILLPFFMIAFFQIMGLIILFHFPIPPVSIIFAKPVRAFFGEQFMHYPANFLLLPRLFNYSQLLISGTIGVIMFGMVIGLICQANIKNEKLRLIGNLNRSIRHCFTLMGIWIIIYILSFIVLRSPQFLIVKFLSKTPLTIFLYKGMFYVGFILVLLIETFFIYAYSAVIIERRKFINAVGRGLSVAKKVFLPTFILITIPRLLDFLIIMLKRYAGLFMKWTVPEITLVILGLSIIVTFIADFLVVSSTANLFILAKEAEDKV